MAPQEAPVIGSLRPFDPTAYTGKAKSTRPDTVTPISELTTAVKVFGKGHVQNWTGAGLSLKSRPCLKEIKPTANDEVVTDDALRALPLARSPGATPVKTSDTNGKQTPDENGTLRLVSLRVIKKIHNTEVNNMRYTFAEIDGWTCKIPPRQYCEGELVLYFQVDSFLPGTDDRFGKARKMQMVNGKLGQKLKTEKLGYGEDKIVSQGMVLPVQRFPEIWKEIELVRQVISTGIMERNVRLINMTLLVMYRNKNWAEVLGVQKWEETAAQPQPQPQPEHQRLGMYPTGVFRRTDVSRVEDCPNLFIKHKYDRLVYQESVKMDGCAMVVYFVKKTSAHFSSLNPLPDKIGPNTVLETGRFGVCSNKVDKNELEVMGPAAFRYWETALRYDLPAKLSKLGRNIAIQGELCGASIQNNREGVPDGEQDFFVFAMFDIDRQDFINPKVVETMAEELGLKHVPVMGYVKLTEIAASHADLKKRAAQRKGEGLVFKCLADGRRFKVISNTYLLEHGL
ncbi:hypothetical protein Daus18300_002715 [Diaporthe australafricana]|uniref:RNA ligase domain-containing protein n=1 Tax=Diaporthe australafricana TaxID=127596 RepID=A0ABR3XKI7_9PEZI